MGEYATTMTGDRIKIGTCESMYYLRADQVPQLASSDVDGHWDAVRFRFPFPDEDAVAPGDFGDFERRLRVDNLTAAEVCPVDPDEHYRVQFTAESHGYLMSVPCPEVHEDERVHRNGFPGSVFLVQQRIWDGRLVSVFQCACGIAWRVETLDQAERYIVALRSAADNEQAHADRYCRQHPEREPFIDSGATFLHAIADRITAGYTDPPAWVVEFSARQVSR